MIIANGVLSILKKTKHHQASGGWKWKLLWVIVARSKNYRSLKFFARCGPNKQKTTLISTRAFIQKNGLFLIDVI